MGKKGIFLIIVSMLLVVGIVIGVTLKMNPEDTTEAEVTEESSEKAEAETDAQEETEAEKNDTGFDVSGKEAAAALIGQTVTREEIQAAVGEWEDFEMSSAGCERGVYAGKFFYKDFNIFSRTYDKGKTFSIVQVNE